MAVDLKRLVPSFELVVDGQKADPELAGSVIGIRYSDDMDRAGRFQLHLSDVDRKWTKIDKFKVGTQIEIKLGYVGQLKSVCKAEVKTLEVVLTPDGPTRLLVAGFDKGQSFTKGTQTKTYKNVKDSDLATQIAQRSGLTADVDDSQVVHEYVIQSNQSDYDFLLQRAVIAGFRFSVDDKKLTFKKPQIGQAAAAKLVWRENIGRLAVEVNTYDQVSKITSSGWAPDTMKTMTSPSKKGDELGTQGGQVTGAQLTKKMFGEIESVLTIASGEQSLLDAMAKAEFNKRGANFVMAEGRITGDPAVRAGTVVEVDKAGQRLNGEYYVTGSEHLFFVDTGYATEFRARRFAINKQTPPPKNPGKAAAAAQQIAKQAKEAAKQAEQASKFKLEAAREAQKRGQQAAEAAKNVLDRAKQALDQAKQGGGDLARATLAQAEKKIAEAKQYLDEALSKVNAAAVEASAAADDMGKRALNAAHTAAGNVLELARGAVQHASDGFDAAKAAALDALHTTEGEGEQFSSQVKAAKNSLFSKAHACLTAGKTGVATAQGSIAKAKNAIEMCAAKSPDAAKSIIGGLGKDVSKLEDIGKQTAKASQESILAAISAGAQHAADRARSAVARSQDAIAKAKDAAKNAQSAPDAQKLAAKAAEERQRAEAALAKAKAQLGKNDELARLLPSRPGLADAKEGAMKAAQSAAAAAQNATRTAGDAGAAALAACNAPGNEAALQGALVAIAESEKAAKKASEAVESAQSAVRSASQGDGAAAKQAAAQAASQQQSAASASASAGAAAQRSQQSAAAPASAGPSSAPASPAPAAAPDSKAAAGGGAAPEAGAAAAAPPPTPPTAVAATATPAAVARPAAAPAVAAPGVAAPASPAAMASAAPAAVAPVAAPVAPAAPEAPGVPEAPSPVAAQPPEIPVVPAAPSIPDLASGAHAAPEIGDLIAIPGAAAGATGGAAPSGAAIEFAQTAGAAAMTARAVAEDPQRAAKDNAIKAAKEAAPDTAKAENVAGVAKAATSDPVGTARQANIEATKSSLDRTADAAAKLAPKGDAPVPQTPDCDGGGDSGTGGAS